MRNLPQIPCKSRVKRCKQKNVYKYHGLNKNLYICRLKIDVIMKRAVQNFISQRIE